MPDPNLREGGRIQSGSETGVPRSLKKCSLLLSGCSFILPSLNLTSSSTRETASEKPRLLVKPHQRSPASLHPHSPLLRRLLLVVWLKCCTIRAHPVPEP